MTPINVMGDAPGDIFWDLPPVVSYVPGQAIGATIYVANPTDTEKEYALMAELWSGEVAVSQEAIPVFGHAWFAVAPGDFVRLIGELVFEETDVSLVVQLVERETEEVVDSVSTYLVTPAAAGLPTWPGPWPGGPEVVQAGFDWLGPMMMLAMMGMVLSPQKPREEEPAVTSVEERRLLPVGRWS